jgi:hypothetical protein
MGKMNGSLSGFQEAPFQLGQKHTIIERYSGFSFAFEVVQVSHQQSPELPDPDEDQRPSKGLADMQQDLLDDLYDDRLLNECYQKLLDGAVDEAMGELIDGLNERRANSSDLEWKGFVQLCMLHPIRELLHQDPFTLRAFEKPRGYAGDANLLDFVYATDEGLGPPEGTSELGRKIFQYSTRTPLCEGVHTGARLVAETVDRFALERHRPSILSVASGHLREANLCGALKQRRIGRWVAMDSDTDSLEEVQRCFGRYGVETLAGTVRQLLSKGLDLGNFDFIYAMGLFDYLQQPVAKRLTERLFDMLRPGGQLLIANFLSGIEARGYMESFMDWYLIYRSHPQMLDLAMSIDQAQVKDIRLLAEDLQNIVFLQVTKK